MEYLLFKVVQSICKEDYIELYMREKSCKELKKGVRNVNVLE